MDDNAKHASSFQLDQEILDARGIDMTVAEVAGLSTTKYSEKVQSLRLNEEDSAFLKGLRRRIKNRLASQNSRRRSMEHLRRLSRELRAVRACKGDAVAERGSLLQHRHSLVERCCRLREHIEKVLGERSDPSPIPDIEVTIKKEPQTNHKESHNRTPKPPIEAPAKKVIATTTKSLPDIIRDQKEKDLFECRIEKLVQQSVNHIFKAENTKTIESEIKKVSAKTVFITNGDVESIVSHTNLEGGFKDAFSEESGVLNLSVKEGRRSHGRKQSAPRRIAYAFCDNDDSVLDLKIKKENQ